MTEPTLGRIVTAMATPFREDLSLDVEGARRLAAHLVDTGTETVLLSGTTGESPTLSSDEVSELVAAVRQEVGDRAKVMVGTGTNSTAKSVEATRRAEGDGADAVLVVTPYYNKPDQRGLVEHFTTVAEATRLPVIVYDIPGRTGREVSVDTLVTLGEEVDNVVGVKDAALDLEKTAELAARAPEGFEIYSGQDSLNLQILSLGGVGFVSVAAHLVGRDLAEMAEVFPSDPVKAREIHLRLVPLYLALFLDPNPAPLKAALAEVGLPAGPVRPPLVGARDETRSALLEALERAGARR